MTLTIDAFQCIECKNILRPPIKLTSIGNMCLHHESHNGDTSSYEAEPSLRNVHLEQMMEHITCACSFEKNGCEEIVKLHEISEHEQSCKFKTFTCMLADCEWSGVESGYVSHLHEHTDYIERGSDGMFPLLCDTEGTDDVRILRTVSGLSLLHVKVFLDRLICAVYDTENRYSESYKIWMTCSTPVNSKIHNEHPCQIVDSWSRFIDFESVAGTEIKFDNLNPVNNKKVTVCLEHVFSGEIVSSELEDKSKYEGRLLKLLEKMRVRLPCGNAIRGCRQQHTPESQHENTSCYYKSWKCCVEIDCTFEHLFNKLVDHIENNHESIRHNETTVPLNLSSHKITFIIYGNIFILEYKNFSTVPMINSSDTLSKVGQQISPSNKQCFSQSLGSMPSFNNIQPTFGSQPSLKSRSSGSKSNLLSQQVTFEKCKPFNFSQPDESSRTEQKSVFNFPRLEESSKQFLANTGSVQNLGARESNDTWQSCPQMKWQVLQLTNRSDTSVNFGVEITINSPESPKSFHYKDGFKKNHFNEDRWELLITNSVLKTLVPQCTEARVRIIKMKK